MSRIIISLLVSSCTLLSWAQGAPALVYEGRSDLPGAIPYRVEIFTHPDGLVSRIEISAGSPLSQECLVSVTESGGRIIGEIKGPGREGSISIVEDGMAIDCDFADRSTATGRNEDMKHKLLLLPRRGVLFEDGTRQFSLAANNEFRLVDSNTGLPIQESAKNVISYNGSRRIEYKRIGESVKVAEFATIGDDAAPIREATVTGDLVSASTVSLKICNYLILDFLCSSPLFVPFVFGLRTGSY
jgi:hypothetical protein